MVTIIHFNLSFNPDFAVRTYYGLQILAATPFYCFYHPVLLMGPQRETIGACVPLLFHSRLKQNYPLRV
jgi:hypothetical protein